MEQLVRKYLCRDDRGNAIKVLEFQEMIDASAKGDVHRNYIPGLKRLQLEGGGAVNFVDDATFKVVATGKSLTVEK